MQEGARVDHGQRQGDHPTGNPSAARRPLRQLNAALRGWATYFRHGASKRTFDYLTHYTWHRVIGWLRRKHRRATWKAIRRRYLAHGLVPADAGIALFNPASVPITRHHYRGTKIPTPWDQ